MINLGSGPPCVYSIFVKLNPKIYACKILDPSMLLHLLLPETTPPTPPKIHRSLVNNTIT